MANMIYSAAFLTGATITSSSANASFPDDDVEYFTYPYRYWKATGDTAEWVTFDFGAAVTPVAFVVDNTNAAQLEIQGDPTNSNWTTPTYDQSVTVSEDPNSGRRKVYHDVVGTPSYQYWRVRNDTALSDSSGILQIGSVSILDSQKQLTYNPGFPYDVQFVQPMLGQGTGEPISVGNRSVQIILNSSVYPGTTFPAELQVLFGLGYDQPIMFYKNDGDASEVYICHVTSSHVLSTAGPNSTRFAQIVLREVSDVVR